MPLKATKPVSQEAVSSLVYDQWYVTQIVGRFDGKKGNTVVTLQRANIGTDGTVTLMPNNDPNATVSFNLDVLKEIANGNAAMGTAFASIVAAVEDYATSKKLL
jgi:hypothetical protein